MANSIPVDVKEIAALAVSGVEMKRIPLDALDKGSNAPSIPALLMPEGYKAELFDRHLPRPTRAVQRVGLAGAGDLVEYVRRFGTPNTAIFADPTKDGCKVVAVIDYHGPDAPAWGSHTATWTARNTAEWAAWKERHGKWFDQSDFATWLDANLDDVVQIAQPGFTPAEAGEAAPLTPAAAHLLMIARKLRGKKNQQWEAGEHAENGDGMQGFTQITTGSAGDGVAIPDYFGVALRVFEGCEPFAQRVRFLFQVVGDSKKLQLRVDLPAMDRVHDMAFREAVKGIHDALPGVPFYHGAP